MPSYAITTFGCQMNVHDSERMHEVLRRAGYVEVDAGLAEVIVLNTCSVREKAEQKLLSEVGRLAKQKRARRDLTVVVAGCVAQQEGERLLEKARGIDLVVGPDNIRELPRLLGELALGAPPLVRTVFDTEAPHFLTAQAGAHEGGAPRPLRAAGAPCTAFVTVMKGCDERCSFCIVPYTRGPERYRPSGEIVAEIAALVDAGVREVTLLGQTVNSYRDPTAALAPAPGQVEPSDPDESEFAALLRHVAASVPGLLRLRYTSPHPRHLTPSLIRAHAEVPALARHVHRPVQSGSDRVLRRMIRRYTRAEYVDRVGARRSAVPGVTQSTDVIVGFPGEDESDFAETLSLVDEVGFTGLFGFKYSERPYTPARKLGDDVPEAVKSERLARLFARSEELLGEHLAGLLGTTQRVLAEGLDEGAHDGGGRWSGRTERNEIVHVAGAADRDLAGRVVEVSVVKRYKHSLLGELTAAARSAAPLRRAPPPGLAGLAGPPAARRSLPVVVGGT